jgi:predicted amidohydrolase YtcJ
MRETPRAGHRSVIVHFATSTEEQIARIARLGAIVSANPYYPVGFADKFSEFGLGPQRANTMVRSASVLKRHIPLSFHSDLPMGPSAPLNFVWCSVNRVTPSGRVAAPEERIGVEDALRAVTIEAAYSWQKETELGSICPGKIANFTVLDQDPFSVEPIKLNEIPIWGTVFEGRIFPCSVKPGKTTTKIGARLLGHEDYIEGHDRSDDPHGGDPCGVARQVASALMANWRNQQER